MSSPISCIKAYCLPQSRRLRHAADFAAVFRFRHQASSQHIQIYAKPNDLPYSRIGLVVSKKVERGAVRRNKAKRVLRETFRTFQQNHARGMDWVLRLKRPVTGISTTQFMAEIELLMHQLRQCPD